VEYEVEHILKKRRRKGAMQYWVKWKGWPGSSNSWEPRESLLEGAKAMLEDFEANSKATETAKKEAKKEGKEAKTNEGKDDNAAKADPSDAKKGRPKAGSASTFAKRKTKQRVDLTFDSEFLLQPRQQRLANDHARVPLSEVPDEALAAECARRKMQICGGPLRDLLLPQDHGQAQPNGNAHDAVQLLVASRYRTICTVGKGNSSTVYEVESTVTPGRHMAIKDITKVASDGAILDEAASGDVQEVTILRRLDHEAIVSCYEVFESKKACQLVMQLMVGGTLFDHLARRGSALEEVAVHGIMRQLLEGLSHLQQHGIAHRDVKLENLLLADSQTDPEKPMTVKLGDFGLAIDVSRTRGYDGTSEHSIKACEAIRDGYYGTLATMAPEVMADMPRYGPICDCYSAGCVMYSLLSGYHAFDAKNAKCFEKEVRARPVESPAPVEHPEWQQISAQAKAFLQAIMHHYPLERPTASEALELPWMQGGAVATEEAAIPGGYSAASILDAFEKVASAEAIPAEAPAAEMAPPARSDAPSLKLSKRTRISASEQVCTLDLVGTPTRKRRG